MDSRFEVKGLGFLLRVEMGMLEWTSDSLANGKGAQHQSSI